jgi:nucleotide-binding universal stress UspA family protein
MRKVLVATDYSQGAHSALKYAIGMAKDYGATIEIVHAYESPIFYTADMPLSAIEESERIAQLNAESGMKDCLENVKQEMSGIIFGTKVVKGLAGDVVAAIAMQLKADLILTSATSAGSVEKLLIGSTTTATINKAPCKVLVVPPNTVYQKFKKAVFATDLDERHIKEVIQAESLLNPMQTELDFLFIDNSIHGDTEKSDEELLHLVKNHVAYRNRSAFVSTDSDIETGIKNFIQKSQADLAIMVSDRLKFPAMLFHRSLAKKMAQHPGVPLLILHPSE